MAGPAIRCWEFARVLSRQAQVTLVTPHPTSLTPDTFKLVQYDAARLEALASESDLIILSGSTLWRFPFLKTVDVPLVVDIYDPFLLESLPLLSCQPDGERNRRHTDVLDALTDLLTWGDFFMCSSEKQRDYWLGWLNALDRINPLTYDNDPTLRQLIDVVAFGLPDTPPRHTHTVLKGVRPGIEPTDHVVVWGGGVYNWFDPLTLIRAMERVSAQRPDVKLIFLGIRHPNPDVGGGEMAEQAVALSQELGLYEKCVFFNDWTPYNERQNYLLEADVGISLHFAHLETHFSFRTRLLDYIWAALPIIVTRGDVLSTFIEQHQLGWVVDYESVDGVTAAILESAGASRGEFRFRFAAVTPQLSWDTVMQPLVDFCREPRYAPDRQRARSSVQSLTALKRNAGEGNRMHYPTVSVIVLNHNGLRYMKDCFTSLSRLDYPTDRVELVLADNGSSDGSVAYVREHFPHVRIIQFDQNYGFCVGNNRATAQSQSEFVAFLNSDMRVESHWLTELVKALGDEPDVVCSASKILNWDGRLIDFGGTLLSFVGRARADGYHNPDLTAYDDVRYILAACGGAMLINREIFLQVGGFDEDFAAYFEDVDLGWRLWILGYKVVFAPQSVCYHVHFGSSSSLPLAKVEYLYERNALYTIIKNYEPQYLERVLPLALLMQFKRVYLHAQVAGVDMDECRFDPIASSAPAPGIAPVYDARYYLREAWRTLRAGGLLALARQVLDEADRRRGRPVPQFVPAEIESRQQPFYWVEQASIAAANDVIENYDVVMEKRAYIQKHRRRTDLEIFRTVRALSFDVCLDSPEYRRAQQRLVEIFGIEQLFGEIFDPSILLWVAYQGANGE